jgi:hypothetical protein
LFLALVTLILGSCIKDSTNINLNSIEIPASLIAKWNWTSSKEGIADTTNTPHLTGEVRIIEFDANNNYKYYLI